MDLATKEAIIEMQISNDDDDIAANDGDNAAEDIDYGENDK